MASIRICLAQLNPIVGDIDGNCQLVFEAWQKAKEQGADLLVTPELFITGYTPEDLVKKPSLLSRVEAAVVTLAQKCAAGPALLLGAPWREKGQLFNSALLLDGGVLVGACHKRNLPNYDCFDEKRVFTAAPDIVPLAWRGKKIGVMICEDMWSAEISAILKQNGAEMLVVLNGSPYSHGKQAIRHKLAVLRIKETGLPLFYINAVGGQDELVFDGGSFAFGADPASLESYSNILAKEKVEAESPSSYCTPHIDEIIPDYAAPRSQEHMGVVTFDMQTGLISGTTSALNVLATVPEAEAYCAIMVGIRDYVKKNGFETVYLGLSGGIDSALVAALAADAIGAENVRAFMMPSPYTSPESLQDAALCASLTKCSLNELDIAPMMLACAEILKPFFQDMPQNIAEENIQSRSRGLLLMALTNKLGGMVLATGNKSEMAVGYATLYGDMCGGYAPLKDLYKTEVYKLADWRNAHKPEGALGNEGPVIPDTVMVKAPTAELRPNQKDQDSLPPYEILDGILYSLIEQDLGLEATIAKGYEADTVRKVWRLLHSAEYKRRQAPPGPKLSLRHLTRDRRYPITNKYKE